MLSRLEEDDPLVGGEASELRQQVREAFSRDSRPGVEAQVGRRPDELIAAMSVVRDRSEDRRLKHREGLKEAS